MPRHRARQRRWGRRRAPAPPRRRVIELVDARTLLTPDAHVAGLRPKGRYVALCGRDVLPAPLVEPGNGRYCRECAPALPTPRRSR